MNDNKSNIIVLDVETSLDIPVGRVLDGAKDLRTALVIGWTKEDGFHFASSTADCKDILWLLEEATDFLKHRYMRNRDD